MYSMVLMAALTTGVATPDCHRRGGCCGCYGGMGYGCWGCYGGCFGGFGGCYGCWGGYSSWGCGGCYGMGMGMGMGYGFGYGGSGYGATGFGYGGATPGMGIQGGTTRPQGEGLPQPEVEKDKKGRTAAPNRAKLIVDLPTDAKLYIDDLPMKTASGTRSFNTPALEPGQAYYYMVRAEVVRDGKTVSESRRVIVRAGRTVRADFKDLGTPTVATVRAK